jgi:hypothetical protein
MPLAATELIEALNTPRDLLAELMALLKRLPPEETGLSH